MKGGESATWHKIVSYILTEFEYVKPSRVLDHFVDGSWNRVFSIHKGKRAYLGKALVRHKLHSCKGCRKLERPIQSGPPGHRRWHRNFKVKTEAV